jgi:hypothetical protein
LLVTALLVAAAFAVKRHYRRVTEQLRRLDAIVEAADGETALHTEHTPAFGHPSREGISAENVGVGVAAVINSPLERDGAQRQGVSAADRHARTAVVLVNGYNGLGLHTALHVPRMFGDTFRNFVFLSVGSVDAGSFKGAAEIESLRAHTEAEAGRYMAWARAHGYGAAALTAVGHDTTGELMQLAAGAREQFPNSVFFAGQLLFARDSRLNRLLHNHTAFTLQRRFFLANLPFVVLPIRVAN